VRFVCVCVLEVGCHFPLLQSRSITNNPTNSQKDAGAGGGSSGSKAGAGAGGVSSKDPVTVALNSNDPLYAEIRDLHLEALGQTLNEKCV
jgi:hypothetical protein